MPSDERIKSQFFLTDKRSKTKVPFEFSVATNPTEDSVFRDIPSSQLPFASQTLPADEEGRQEIVISGLVDPELQPILAYREWLDNIMHGGRMSPVQIEMEMSMFLDSGIRQSYLFARRALLEAQLRDTGKTIEQQESLRKVLHILQNIK